MELTVLFLLLIGLMLFLLGRKFFGGKPAETERAPDIYEIAEGLSSFYQSSAHPKDLLDNREDFEQGVQYLCRPEMEISTLRNYVTGENSIIACLAIEALRRREDGGDAHDAIFKSVRSIARSPQFFCLRYLTDKTPADEPIICKILTLAVDDLYYSPSASIFTQFIYDRIERGETPSFDNVTTSLDSGDRQELRKFLAGLNPDVGIQLLESFDHWRSDETDLTLLRSAGRVLVGKEAVTDQTIVDHPLLESAVAQLQSALLAERPQSSLIVGERGVGKSTILTKLAGSLCKKGWTVFIASDTDLIAGQVYIGEFEQRLKDIIDQLSGDRRIVWFIPNFHSLAFSGLHKYSKTSALDVILPLVEQGEIRIVGETQPAALERLLAQQPRAVTALSSLRVDPLSPAATLDLARNWAQRRVNIQDPGLISEIADLAQHHLSDQAAPGNLLGLLDATAKEATAATGQARPDLQLSDVIGTLARQTGLNSEILDHHRHLDLDGLKDFLSSRVIGQEEAVDCLVERVAMMKAGVTDLTRPVGVFLFAGPTGTGKTEIAKTLAEWLFGSPNRLLRLDMSEFQTPESLNRLIGSSDEDRSNSLADQIRRQPHSVVLLDEFEKAHPEVWDAFLQVFDDARITDRRGQTASFQNAIILLTSNLGATIPAGLTLGFKPGVQEFDKGEVLRAIDRVFRKEFVNRLDRIVVFRPLSRDLMRRILKKELQTAFQRRGLKYRAWAVEWDESAIEFLLEKGFTLDLGARPLKRAVEQYVLTPLALTIVRHQAPDGDQFLFISSKGNALDVRFVDPDASSVDLELTGADVEPVEDAAAGRPSPTAIMAHPTGTAEELAALRDAYDRIAREVEGESWQARKDAAMSEMKRPDFWSSSDRFAILGMTEYLDRISGGTRRAGSLLSRLEGQLGARRDKAPAEMVRVLAQNLHLLDAACDDVSNDRPRDAYLSVEARADSTQDWHQSVRFANRLASMYENWAAERRMRLTELENLDGGSQLVFRKTYAVSGYGGYSLLASEHGLHVMEWQDKAPGRFARCSVHVRVVPQQDGPSPRGPRDGLSQARQALSSDGEADLAVVRRYREDPSPLVRDAIHGWRSGRLDFILAGNFDAMQ